MTTSEDRPARWRVRPPGEGDHARWRDLYRGYADFYGAQQFETTAQVVWAWVRDPDHEVEALLVEDEHGRVAGLAHYRPFARPLAAATGCYLDDLFVEPSARGSGAADALLAELRGIATARGWSVVRWITAEDNDRARARYDQHATATTWITYDMTP